MPCERMRANANGRSTPILAGITRSLIVRRCPRKVTDTVAMRAERFERAIGAADRVLRAWLAEADPKTLLLPDRLTGPAAAGPPGTRRANTHRTTPAPTCIRT